MTDAVEIPESDALRLRSIERPFAALLAKLQASGHAAGGAVEHELEAFMSHADWERQRPDELAAAQAYEQTRAYKWEQRHGSLEGWAPWREFPCPGQLRIEDESAGSLWVVVCDVCGYGTGVQVQQADPERLLERRLSKAGIPPMFAGKAFEQVPEQAQTLAACRVWIRGFKRDPMPAVALWGSPGRGKTHLLALIVETLIKTYAVDAIYRPAAMIFDQLRAGIDEGTYEALWARYQRVAMLAIDDLGAARMTEWQRERFTTLLDYRYSHALPVICATNLPPHVWAREFGDRAESRMKGIMVALRLEGHDRRAQGVQTRLDDGVSE